MAAKYSQNPGELPLSILALERTARDKLGLSSLNPCILD